MVAVRTAAAPLPTFFGCFERQVEVVPQDIHRAVLGAVLQAGWGVSDTALHWSQATGRWVVSVCNVRTAGHSAWGKGVRNPGCTTLHMLP